MKYKIYNFFDNSEYLDHEVLRPLSHIKINWELTWNLENKKYDEEEDSFAKLLNNLIDEIINTPLQIIIMTMRIF